MPEAQCLTLAGMSPSGRIVPIKASCIHLRFCYGEGDALEVYHQHPQDTCQPPATSHQPWRPRAPSLPGLLSPSSTPSLPLVCEGGEHPARADHQRVPGLFRHEEAMSGTGSAVCFPVFVLSKSPSTWTPWLAVFTCEAMTLRLAQVWSSEKS